MKKKQTRLQQIKRIKKELTQLASKACRDRDGKCVMCGATENLQAHHWLYRKGHSLALAYCVDNLATLCYTCHIIKIHIRAEGHFIMRFLEVMRNKIGPASIANMEEVARNPPPISLEDLQELKEAFLNARKD